RRRERDRRDRVLPAGRRRDSAIGTPEIVWRIATAACGLMLSRERQLAPSIMKVSFDQSQSSPLVTEMRVVPVAGSDSMLLNLSGAHCPFFTRNIVILNDNAGRTG